MDEELLINLVHGYKELYDLQDPHYDDQQRRDNIWKEIGDILKESATTCRDRWRRIRDNYRRAKKLRKTKSGQVATNMKKPKYEDFLSFLNPYITNVDETFSNIPPINISQDSSNEASNLLEDRHSRCSPDAGTSQRNVRDQPGSSEESTPRPYKSNSRSLDTLEDSTPRPYKRNSRSLDTPQHSPTHLLLQDYLEKKYSMKRNKSDKIIDFFKNLGETVSNFPEDVQIQVKRDVFKIVSDAEVLVFNDKSKQQCVFQESPQPIIVINSNDNVQPPQIIIPTSTNVVNPNNIDTAEDIDLVDLDDNAMDAFINSIQQKQGDKM